jgi:Phosphotransferase enzyme family
VAPWPEPVRARLRELWAGRDRILAVAEAAERTLCHLDVWPANLADDAGRSILLDWAFTGAGAVGEDLANLVIDCFTDGLMDIARLPELAETAVDAYLAGLRAGGWAGSDDAVRTAIYASGAAKYSWFGPAMAVRAARDDLGRSSYRQDTSAAAAIHRLTPLVTLIADWADRITALR